MKPACWSLPRDRQRRTSRCLIRVLPQTGHVCCSPAGLYKGFTRAAAPISHAARRARCRTGFHVRRTARFHVCSTTRRPRCTPCPTCCHVRRIARRLRRTPCPTCCHVRRIARRLRRTPCRAHFHARSAPRTSCDKFCLCFFIRCETAFLAAADIGRPGCVEVHHIRRPPTKCTMTPSPVVELKVAGQPWPERGGCV